MQTTCSRNHNKASQDSYLAAKQVRFHKQEDKMNHGARVGRYNRNKGIILNQINEKS